MRVVRTEMVRLASPRAAAIEVVYLEQEPPGRVRLWLSRLLIKLAGKLARMRVRVVREDGMPAFDHSRGS